MDDTTPRAAPFEFEAFFHAHYPRIARIIAGILGDPSRAEDLALDSFWKLWRNPKAQGDKAGGWLYRTAIRMGLNELRRDGCRAHYESQAELAPAPVTPEEAHSAAESRRQVRSVLAALDHRQAELLLLRNSGLSYSEVAAALDLNPASVGTLIARAQQAFRKEYLKQYGEQ